MLFFGFSSGLPFVLVTGTLTAWFTKANVDLSTIGIFSWVGLAYAFKFLWSPGVNTPLPLLGDLLGRRRGWIIVCQVVVAAATLSIALTDPTTGLGAMALVAAVAAFASATQDISIDAWRIEVADERAPLDVLSAIYQLGYRISSLVGGAGSLILAQHTSWPVTFATAAVLMATTTVATIAAPEPEIKDGRQARAPRTGAALVRLVVVGIVLAAWGWSAFVLISFMASAVTSVPPPNAKAFTAFYGPLIVTATILIPCGLSAWIARGGSLPNADKTVLGARVQGIADRLYTGIVEPLVELMSRLGLASILVVILILTYQITYAIWAPFAYPFYIGALGFSLDEVGLASKIIGVFMTILGIGLCAISLVRIGRMATMMLGAVGAAIANLLFADLANGAPYIDAFLSGTGLHQLFALFGLDERMGRLITAIAGDNVATGFASAAFVAYLSSLASKMHGAVQFAVFTSLTLLVGTLGRGALGDMIKEQGYAAMFQFAALLGVISIFFVALEWWRQSRSEQIGT
jgi:PAT family beta-lactamase induction signal transducer AmpG